MIMKKTQILELLRNIKSHRVSFIAITIFVMLGIALYLGIGWTGDALKASATKDFDTYSMYDIEVIFPYGFSKENIEEIAKVPGVDSIHEIQYYFQFFETNGLIKQAKVLSLTDDINKLNVIDGTLPTKAGEVAIEKTFADKEGIKVGDVITFRHDDKGNAYALKNLLSEDLDAFNDAEPTADGMERLTVDTVKITALVESPAYMCAFPITFGSAYTNAAPIDCIMFVTDDTFDMDAYTGNISLLIKSNELEGLDAKSDVFKTKSEKLKEDILSVASKIADEKNDNIALSGQNIVAEYKARLEDAKQQIADAEAKIEKAKQDLERSKRELQDAQKKVDSGKKEIAKKEAELKKGKAQLADAQELFDQLDEIYKMFKGIYERHEFTYDVVYELLDEANNRGILKSIKTLVNRLPVDDIPFLDQSLIDEYNSFYNNFNSGYYETHKEDLLPAVLGIESRLSSVWEDAKSELNSAKKKIANGEAQLKSAKKDIADAERKIANGWAEVRKAENVTIPNYEKQLEIAKADYEAALARLPEFEAEIASIGRMGAAAISRESNGGAVVVDVVSDVFAKMRYSMAILFVIVGLFVCYSAVSRKVYEETVLLGTKKALGLYNREITIAELGFTLLAAIIGSILGILLGRFGVEQYLFAVSKENFTCDSSLLYFDIKDTLIIVTIEIGTILVTTYLACRKVLKRSAVKMLAGAEPPSAKSRFYEKTKMWNRMSLLSKTIINNCLNDPRRCFATIVGIAGCTSLIVCSVTVYHNISNSVKRQFDSITTFDTMVYVEDGSADKVASVLDKNGIEYSELYYALGALDMPNDRQIVGEIMVPVDNNFSKFVHMIDDNGDEKQLSNGAWVCKSYMYFFDAKPGDPTAFVDSIGTKHDFTIENTSEYYLTRTAMFADRNSFEKAFGHPATANCIVLNKGDLSYKDLTAMLKDTEGFISVFDFYSAGAEEFDVYLSVMIAIVLVYLALSVVMAFLVLLNLFTMFIDEQKKQLIVMMINGFSVHDAKKYIYSDTTVLTIVGMIIGIALGGTVGFFTLRTLVSEGSYFILHIAPVAFLIGIAVCAVMTIATLLIALRRVDKFKLTDINSER